MPPLGSQVAGSVIREYRLRAGLSMNALAIKAGVVASYVHRLEAYKNSGVSRDVALAFARALGLDDLETDRFLFRLGYAPIEDWQARALDAERRLDAVRRALIKEGEPLWRSSSPPERGSSSTTSDTESNPTRCGTSSTTAGPAP